MTSSAIPKEGNYSESCEIKCGQDPTEHEGLDIHEEDLPIGFLEGPTDAGIFNSDYQDEVTDAGVTPIQYSEDNDLRRLEVTSF